MGSRICFHLHSLPPPTHSSPDFILVISGLNDSEANELMLGLLREIIVYFMCYPESFWLIPEIQWKYQGLSQAHRVFQIWKPGIRQDSNAQAFLYVDLCSCVFYKQTNRMALPCTFWHQIHQNKREKELNQKRKPNKVTVIWQKEFSKGERRP